MTTPTPTIKPRAGRPPKARSIQVAPGVSLSISLGNSKLGAIPSFSLPPGASCRWASCPAGEDCYAWRYCQFRPVVEKRYLQNMEAFLTHPRESQQALQDFLAKAQPVLFRVHVSGDFFSPEYMALWTDIIQASPQTLFLTFTKVYHVDLFKPYFRELIRLPNHTVFLSRWPGMPPIPEEFKHLPRAYLDDDEEFKQEDPQQYFRCTGACDECATCWALPRGYRGVVFKKH